MIIMLKKKKFKVLSASTPFSKSKIAASKPIYKLKILRYLQQ